MAKPIPISEIFGPTVQGEGALIGRPTVFVRTGGCDFRCAWCDTLYAVLPEHRAAWTPMTDAAILDEVDRLAGDPILVTLSGGNPAIHDCAGLLRVGTDRGHTFTMETQGSIARDWFAALDHLTLSPKPPSAGMDFDLAALRACVEAAGGGSPSGPDTHLKIVVLDEADFAWAREVAGRFDLPVYLQVCNDGGDLMARFDWLVERVRESRWYEVTVLPQLHVLAWGNRRGV